ncbi:MAG: FecR family protein, partial [Chthonomonadales bacterium]|nr:FecR family protein [Chthonomonadales bacterium]
MAMKRQSKPTGRLLLAALAAVGMCCVRPALAQDDGYHVGEDKTIPPPAAAKPTRSPTHRVARIDYLSGKITYRSKESENWQRMKINDALLEGGQLKVEEGARVEISFDDGSILRLGSNAVITLQTVFVDDQGEYTQIKMNSGIAMLEPREERSVFEIDTPTLTVKTMGPSRVRIGVDSAVEVALSRGRANLEGSQGKTTLDSGDFVLMHSADTLYNIKALPSPDSWERWNEDRDLKRTAQPYPDRRSSPPSRAGLSIFFSLGFPIYGGDRRSGYRYYGRAEYHG